MGYIYSVEKCWAWDQNGSQKSMKHWRHSLLTTCGILISQQWPTTSLRLLLGTWFYHILSRLCVFAQHMYHGNINALATSSVRQRCFWNQPLEWKKEQKNWRPSTALIEQQKKWDKILIAAQSNNMDLQKFKSAMAQAIASKYVSKVESSEKITSLIPLGEPYQGKASPLELEKV